MNIKSVKVQLSIFLILFALSLFLTGKDTAFLSSLGISLVSAAAVDSIIRYFKTRKITITESSIVTGLIIGYVVSSDQPWLVIIAASIFAIGSKHLIRFKARHIFNPAGFGIVLAVFIFDAATQWKGTYLWYVLVPAGFYFVSKIRKLELVVSYFAASLILFGCQAAIQGVDILSIFYYFSYFFIFIMMIEPITTPVSRAGKIMFGAGIGVMIFILSNIGVKETELVALLFFNMFTRFLDRQGLPALNKGRKK